MPTFEDYDMISDLIDWLGMNVQYKFVVKLANKDKNGSRNPFHKEYKYPSTYNDVETSTSIVRSFDYYVTIENKREGVYIQIRQANLIMVQTVLSQMTEYLFNDSYWGVKEKKLVLKGKPQPIYIQNLPMCKWLGFELIVIEYEGIYDKGIRITLADESQYVDVRIDSFMGFVSFMSNLNMYQSALSIVNYLQRPEYGTNMVTFDGNNENGYNNTYNNKDGVTSKNNRIIPTRPKSFFDKVDRL